MFSLENKLATFFSIPFLIFILPRTYWRLFKNVTIPSKEDHYITGFSSHMALILTWYLRIADCVKKYGRHGYIYEDGLGSSLKERFWSNSFSLKIYNTLKIKKFTILTVVILLFNIILIGFLQNSPWPLIIVLILLIIGSPLFLISFFRLSKPEILSWAFFPLVIYFFLNGYYLVSGLFLIFIAFLNFTTTLLTIETILLCSLVSNSFINGILISIIPLVILAIDFIPFLRGSIINGVLEALGGRRAKSRTDEFLRIRLNDLYLIFFYLIFIVTFVIKDASFIHVVLLINPLILFIIDRNIFRFADNNTFFRFFFALSTVFVLMNPHFLVFLAYIIFLYMSPLSMLEVFESIPKEYPHLKPHSIKKSKEFLEKTFSPISNQSRIVFEIKDTEKSLSGFSTLLYYFEYIFIKRGIELLPMEWLRMNQTDYLINEYVKINKESDQETIEEKLKELGAQYLIAHSSEFINKLKQWGYQNVIIIRWQDIKKTLWDFKGVLIPEKDLFIFKVPFSTSFIEPETNLTRKPNQMEFNAQANKEYIIKYNYHPSWQVWQNNKEIPVYKAKGNLSYLALSPKESGQMVLKFNTHWYK